MKAMKKIIALICAAVMLMSLPVTISLADNDIEVYLNGNRIYFEDQQPVIIDGRTLVPMRAVFEAMSAQVDWYGDTQSIDIVKDSISLTLYINHAVIYGNFSGSPANISIDVPPQIINGRTMVPLRAISETIGAEVDWYDDTRSVYIWDDSDDYSDNYKDDSDFLNGYFDGTDINDEYYAAYSKVLNFGKYYGEAPYHSDYGEYYFDYYDITLKNLDDYILPYLSDLQDEGYTFLSTDDRNGAWHYTLSGYGYSIEIVDDYSLGHVEMYIHGSYNPSVSTPTATPKPTATATPRLTQTPTPKPTAVPTPKPTQAPTFKYLKEFDHSNTTIDSSDSYIKTVSNGISLYLARSKKKNPNLDVGDECIISSDYYLDGQYNKLTGIMTGSGTTALRIYCDGKVIHTTPFIGGTGTDLNLDITGCDVLTIEEFGIVKNSASTAHITIKDAKLWYE